MPAVIPITTHTKVAIYAAVVDTNGHEGELIRVGEATLATDAYVTVKAT